MAKKKMEREEGRKGGKCKEKWRKKKMVSSVASKSRQMEGKTIWLCCQCKHEGHVQQLVEILLPGLGNGWFTFWMKALWWAWHGSSGATAQIGDGDSWWPLPPPSSVFSNPDKKGEITDSWSGCFLLYATSGLTLLCSYTLLEMLFLHVWSSGIFYLNSCENRLPWSSFWTLSAWIIKVVLLDDRSRFPESQVHIAF